MGTSPRSSVSSFVSIGPPYLFPSNGRLFSLAVGKGCGMHCIPFQYRGGVCRCACSSATQRRCSGGNRLCRYDGKHLRISPPLLQVPVNSPLLPRRGRFRRSRSEAFRQYALKLVPSNIAAANDYGHAFPCVVGGSLLKSCECNACRTFYGLSLIHI